MLPFQNIQRNLVRLLPAANKLVVASALPSKQHSNLPPKAQLTLFATERVKQLNTSATAQHHQQKLGAQNITFLQVKRNLVLQKRRSLKVSETKLPKRFKMEWPKITLFGDSITRRSFDPDFGCWASHVANKVGSYFDVDQRGFEGYNSEWALEVVPKLFPKSYLDKVELFVMFFGHNDSWDSNFPTNLSVSQYEANMRSILKYLLENGIKRNQIILITPTWFHLEQFKKFLSEANLPSTGKSFERAQEFASAITRIGADEGIDVVDFFDVSSKHKPLGEMFCDGVHFSRVGAKMLFDCLMPVIERKIEDTYKKPLADLWHIIPFDQHPKVKPLIEKYQEQLKKLNLSSSKD